MKNNKLIKILVLLLIMFNTSILFGQPQGYNCTTINGDIENGAGSNPDIPQNFEAYIGNYQTVSNSVITNINTFSIGTGTSFNTGTKRHEIVTSPNMDPLISTIPQVLDGKFAIKLGNHETSSESEIISTQVTLSVAREIAFSWAAVLDDGGGHTPTLGGGNPFFGYWVSRSNDLQQSILPGNFLTEEMFIANSADPFWNVTNINGKDINYKNWQTKCVDLSQFAEEGETVTIYFIVADCKHAGHFGYAYIDNICNDYLKPCFTLSNNKVCTLSDIIADPSCSLNVSETQDWSFSKVYNNINNNSSNIVASCHLINNGPLSPINIGSIPGANALYGAYGPGWYAVQLTFTGCFTVESYWEYIYLDYSTIKAENVFTCCKDTKVQLNASIDIVDPNTIGQFEWYDENNNFISNGINNYTTTNGINTGIENTHSIIVNKSGKYTVKYTNLLGCYAEKVVYVLLIGNPVFELKKQECWPGNQNNILSTPCGARQIKVFYNGTTPCEGDTWAQFENNQLWHTLVDDYYNNNVINNFSYLWNTGATTDFVHINSTNTNYTCKITWKCGLVSKSINAKYNEFTGALPTFANGQLFAPTAFSPNGDGLNDCFRIRHVGFPIGTPNSYNAYEYELRIFNQWGNQIFTKNNAPESKCYGLINGEIQFCPPAYSLPIDTYSFLLLLKNCDNNTLVPVYAGFFDAIY